MRVLLDANVLVRANSKSQDPARSLLLLLIERGHTIVLSRAMLREMTAVLRYPALQHLYSLSDAEIYEFSQYLTAACELAEIDTHLPVPMRDPKDHDVLRTALCGEVDILCTRDSDFHEGEAKAFCDAIGIEVVDDLELLRRLRA